MFNLKEAQTAGTVGCRMIGIAADGKLKMKRIHSALASKIWAESSEWHLTRRKDPPSESRFVRRANTCAIFLIAATLPLMSGYAFGQTTRTNPSSSSTSSTIPSSSSTSPNSPCSPTNPSSPCYSAKSPRNPCYSAVAPNEPCSSTITPPSQPSAAPEPRGATTTQAAVRAFTEDQAKSQIEAKGYSSVSGLRRDTKGRWSGKAEKDGSLVNVTLDVNGNVTTNY